MIVIFGCLVVIGCVLGGFVWAGGHVHALIHPNEVLTIGGAALGALIVMSPAKVLKDLIRALIQCFKGSPYNKQLYESLFQAMYELFRIGRRDGLLALEPHLESPQNSSIFSKYPALANNHHVMEFICGALSPVVDGSVTPEKLPELLAAEIHVIEDEHHAPLAVLLKTADALPGFGIVAAVLGIVITMGHIDGPVEEIGHKVGSALVGTFLGILLSYGFFSPLAAKMEFLGHLEAAFFRAIAVIIEGFVNDLSPKVAVEQARRRLTTDVRPSREQLESMLKAIDASA